MRCCNDRMVETKPGNFMCVWCENERKKVKMVHFQPKKRKNLQKINKNKQFLTKKTHFWSSLIAIASTCAVISMQLTGVCCKDNSANDSVYVYKSVQDINPHTNF